MDERSRYINWGVYTNTDMVHDSGTDSSNQYLFLDESWCEMKDNLNKYPDVTSHHLHSHSIDQGQQSRDSQVYLPTTCDNTSFHAFLSPLYPPPTFQGQDMCPQSQEQSPDLHPVSPAQNATTFYFADREQTQLIRPGVQSHVSATRGCDVSLYSSETKSRFTSPQREQSVQDPASLTGLPYESITATSVNVEDLKLMYVVNSHIFSMSVDSIDSCAFLQEQA